MSGTRTCQACGLENPADQDFCSCGEYLRWEPTNYQQAITPEMAAQARPAHEAASANPAVPPVPPPAPPAAAVPPTPPAPQAPQYHTPAPPAPPDGGHVPQQYQAPVPPDNGGQAPQQQYQAPVPPGNGGQTPQQYQAPVPPGNGAPAAAPQPASPPAPSYQTYQAPSSPPVPVTPRAAPPTQAAPPAAPAAPQGPSGTAIQQRVPAPPAPPAAPVAPPQQPQQPELVSMTLRVNSPGGEAAVSPEPGEALRFAVEPGGTTSLTLKIRNQSGIVDNYDIGVRGLPEHWYQVLPPTVYLVPFGSSGMYEQEVTITIAPPRTPDSESRFWDFEVTAHSKAHEAEAGAAPASMFVHPYEDYDAKVKPERRTARRRATYTAEVENKANAEQVVWLSSTDPDLALRFAFDPPYVKLRPGEKGTSELTVRPHKKILFGHRVERRFELGTHMGTAEEKPEDVLVMEENSKKRKRKKLFDRRRIASKAGVSGPRVQKGYLNIGPSGPQFQGPSMYKGNVSGKQVNFDQLKMPGFRRGPQAGLPAGPLMPRQAAFAQKPIIPYWLLMIIPLLIIAAIIIWLLWPRQVTVPDVRKEPGVRAAEKVLKDKELRLEKVDEKVVTDRAQIGKLLDQAPSPGKKVDKQTGVTVVVGVGNGKVPVPDLKGKTVTEADTILRRSNLTLGAVKPTDEDQKATVRTQLPLAEELVREGSTVGINVVKPKKAGKESGGGGDKDEEQPSGGGGGAPTGGADGEIVVPPFEGKDAETYAGLVGDESLIPDVVRVFDKAERGTVIRTDPPPGTKAEAEQVVRVFVSAGIPTIAYDDTEDVRRLDGADGKPLPAVAKTGAREENPTWSPDAEKVVFTQDDRLFVQDMTDLEKSAVALTREGVAYDIPAFAPTVEDEILAMTRRTERKGQVPEFDGDLCFAKLNGNRRIAPDCIEDDDFTLYGHISWAPDGKSLVVTGTDLKDAARFGLIRYESEKAFSPNPADWGKGKLVTSDEELNEGVIWGDFSPDGKKLAVAANTKGGQFRLYVTTPDDFALEKPVETPVVGCELAWRGDSQELAVVVKDPRTCGSGIGTSLVGPITTVKVVDTKDGFTVDAATARNIENSGRHPQYKPGNLGKPAGQGEDDAAAGGAAPAPTP